MYDNFLLDEIVSIEEMGERETVDIAVSGDNLFIANKILTHNCGFGNHNPELSTISESMGLAMTADCIVSIFQNEEDRELGIIRLGMMKNRYGARGHTQPMRIDYSTLTITEAEEDSFTDGQDDTFQALSHLMDD
jgi:hypothetical protein